MDIHEGPRRLLVPHPAPRRRNQSRGAFPTLRSTVQQVLQATEGKDTDDVLFVIHLPFHNLAFPSYSRLHVGTRSLFHGRYLRLVSVSLVFAGTCLTNIHDYVN